MNRSRSQLDLHHTRPLSTHKPGVIPKASRDISPITSNHHKYELKQKIWPKRTVESWFANHSSDDRRAVYSFLNTLYDGNNHSPIERPRKSSNTRSPIRTNTTVEHSSTHLLQRRISNNSGHESRSSKRDLGEILESLESYRPASSVHEKAIQTSAVPLPDVNQIKISRQTTKHAGRSASSLDKHTEIVQPENTNDDENNKLNRRYLSQTWRVINPREDIEANTRPENNASSFFNFTKKVYPEYFFIHPDWY